MQLETGLTLQLILAFLLLALGAWLWAWRQWLLFRDQQSSRTASPTVAPSPTLKPLPSSAPLTDAGAASATPPSFSALMQELSREYPNGRYRYPLGWLVAGGRQSLACGMLVQDTNHILISGQSDSGKDNTALTILFALALAHPPRELQVCVIDGKGLDFAGWSDRQHCWRLALRPAEIAPTMHALTAERERRATLLRAAGVTKWENYRGGDLPLLVVFVSELSLLQDATSARELDSWLNSELAAARAFGVRYIVATQTATNFSTRWRSQVGVYLAGFQPRDDQDEPNTSMTGRAIRELRAVPPSALPAPPHGAGVFTLVFGRTATNVRSTYLGEDERAHLLALLPRKTETAETKSGVSGHSNALEAFQMSGATGLSGDHGKPETIDMSDISEDERIAILVAAQTETSRRAVCQKVFGSPHGRAYQKVKRVCDAAGLLMGEPSVITSA